MADALPPASPSTNLSALRRAWRLIPAGRHRRFVQVAVLSVFVSSIEAAAAAAVATLLALVLEPGQIPSLPVIGPLDGILPVSDYTGVVRWTTGLFAVFFVLRAAVFLAREHVMHRTVDNTALLLSDRMVEGYLSMPYEWHIQRSSAELLRNAWDGVQQVTNDVFRPMANLVAEGAVAIALTAVLAISAPLLAGATAVLLGATLAITLAVVQPRLKRMGQERQDAAKRSLREAQQAFGGIRDVKMLGREGAFARRFFRARAEMARISFRRHTMLMVPGTSVELVFLLLLLFGLAAAAEAGQLDDTLATLGVFAYAGFRMHPALRKIAMASNSLRFATAAIDDLSEGLDELDRRYAGRIDDDRDRSPHTWSEAVTFDAVDYRYPGSDRPAVEGVTLTIPRGTSLGVVGVTGGGKSTFLDVLCGLLPPTAGTVAVDGTPLTEVERAWQRGIGMVHQTAFLVDATLRENVALGVDDGTIDDERVRACLGKARLDEVVAMLPDGLDTVLGEDGQRFSGGQRQRVTIARALYHDPSMLILDEGTASLDNRTERELIRGLAEDGDLTLVMVAHRIDSVRHCDQIVLFDEGRLTASGTYDELLASEAAFRELTAAGDGP